MNDNENGSKQADIVSEQSTNALYKEALNAKYSGPISIDTTP